MNLVKMVGKQFVAKKRSGSIPQNATVTVTHILYLPEEKPRICVDLGRYALTQEDFIEIFGDPDQKI